MKLFGNALLNRAAIGKLVGFMFGGMAFCLLPLIFSESDLFLRFGIWFWYISLGAIIGIFGVLDKINILKTNISVPFWIRGTLLGAWMNFVLILFIHDKITILMQNSIFTGMSPFWLILEGALFGFLADFFATKFAGEGKKLMN